MSQASLPWGRGTGEGIGLSGHKNEYKTGVRIGNWVEEQFSAEASANAHDMEKFLRTQEEAYVAKAKAQTAERNERIEPNMGVAAQMLFSHGKTHGEKFAAAMTALHFTDPAQRGACHTAPGCANGLYLCMSPATACPSLRRRRPRHLCIRHASH